MKDEHIISLLDSNPLSLLTSAERHQIQEHATACVDCRQAYAAASRANALLRARTAQTIEPSPFFATRVMASLRERQSAPALFDPMSLWKTARALVFSGVGAVVILAALTFVTPPPANDNPEVAFVPGNYPAERVVFADDASLADDNLSNDQVMDNVLIPEGADAGNEK